MDPGDSTVAIVALFSTTLLGLSSITACTDPPRGTEALWQQMRIQCARLRVWGAQWGLEEGTYRGPGVAPKDGDKAVYTKLRRFLTDWPSVGEGIEKALLSAMEFLVARKRLEEKFGFVRVRRPREDVHDRDVTDLWRSSSSLPVNSVVRLEVIRRAFSHLIMYRYTIEVHGFEGFISHLMRYTDALWNLCSPNMRHLMSYALLPEMLANESDINRLLHLSKAAEVEANLLSGVSRTLYLSTYQTLSKAARLRARLGLDEKPAPELDIRDYDLVSSSVYDGKDSRLVVSRRHNRVYLVEYKNIQVPGTSHAKAMYWLQQLSRLLYAPDKPSGFRLRDCKGYFVDHRKGQWGFVFDLPPHCGIIPSFTDLGRKELHLRRPTSLKELLSKAEDPPIDLQIRFIIARKLVATVATIHAAGYYHRNIRASSVLFFPEPSSSGEGPSKSRKKDLSDPWLQGWGYIDALDVSSSAELLSSARPSSSSSTALVPASSSSSSSAAKKLAKLDRYQHPYLTRYPNAPFCRAFDLYSLGILLLEIGLWQQVSSMTSGWEDADGSGQWEVQWAGYGPGAATGKGVKSKEEAADRWRLHLERNYVADLAGQAGGRYMECVRRLMGMWAFGAENEREVEMAEVWDVLRRLEECTA